MAVGCAVVTPVFSASFFQCRSRMPGLRMHCSSGMCSLNSSSLSLTCATTLSGPSSPTSRALHPHGVGALEVDRRGPQGEVRLEIGRELVELRVLGERPAEELLARVVLRRAHAALLELGLQLRHELREVLDLELPRLELLGEPVALIPQCLHEVVAVLLRLLVGLGDDAVELGGPAQRALHSVEGLVGQRVVEGREQRDARAELGVDGLLVLRQLDGARLKVLLHGRHLLGVGRAHGELGVDRLVLAADLLGDGEQLLRHEPAHPHGQRARLVGERLLKLGALHEQQAAVHVGGARRARALRRGAPLGDGRAVAVELELLLLQLVEVRRLVQRGELGELGEQHLVQLLRPLQRGVEQDVQLRLRVQEALVLRAQRTEPGLRQVVPHKGAGLQLRHPRGLAEQGAHRVREPGPDLIEARLEDELPVDQAQRHLQQRRRRGRQRVHPLLSLGVELGRRRGALAEQREHRLHGGEHHTLQLVLHELRHLPQQPLHERAVVLLRTEARGQVGVAHGPLHDGLLRQHPLRLQTLGHGAETRLL
eukprot:scaffold69124_cov65-Phaeocystis_antarctica.AAC.2